jgi:hypothetical protein
MVPARIKRGGLARKRHATRSRNVPRPPHICSALRERIPLCTHHPRPWTLRGTQTDGKEAGEGVSEGRWACRCTASRASTFTRMSPQHDRSPPTRRYALNAGSAAARRTLLESAVSLLPGHFGNGGEPHEELWMHVHKTKDPLAGDVVPRPSLPSSSPLSQPLGVRTLERRRDGLVHVEVLVGREPSHEDDGLLLLRQGLVAQKQVPVPVVWHGVVGVSPAH